MSLSSLSIERPVLATVFSIILIIFGGVGFLFLGVREFPTTDPPIITVTTNYVGAAADIIESQITEPLEESINGISGIRTLTSTSADGRSIITVEFTIQTNLEAAANDVRDRVARAVRLLPADADPPIVAKSDADAGFIISIALQSTERDLLSLTEIANNIYKERLQTIQGVSAIQIWGEKKYCMRLYLDPNKLASYRLTPLDVKTALDKENVELPSGRLEGTRGELTIRTLGRLVTETDFNELIIKEGAEGTGPIKLKDVGRASLSPENERNSLYGKKAIPLVGVAVVPQPGANYIAIADEFHKRVAKINKEVPSDVSTEVVLDVTSSIRGAIEEVQETIFIAFGLVVLVIFFFLRNWRTTLIPVLAIPISLIATFFLLYLFGFSINILTLLGIVLATGLVVDDAIVVLENIYQKIEEGMPVRQAALAGSGEIFFAIISTTITLAAVFVPIFFLSGITGRLFREFAVVVAGSVLLSAFVSLTLTPMLCSIFLKKETKHNALSQSVEGFLNGLTGGYQRSLNLWVRSPIIALIVMGMAGGLIYFVGKGLPSELAPLEDKSRIQVFATAPEGTSFEMMDRYMFQLAEETDTFKHTQTFVSVVAPGFGIGAVNSGFMRIRLSERNERKESQMEIAETFGNILKKYNFARAFVVQEQTISTGRFTNLPVQFNIQAPDLEALKQVLPKFMEKAQGNSAFQVVDVNLKFNKPELNVSIDRERAKALGVSVMDIAQTLQLFFSGQRFGYFIYKGKQYQVIGQAERDFRSSPGDLSTLYVRNKDGEMIPIENVVHPVAQATPPQLFRTDRYASATIQAGLTPGVSLGEGLDVMRTIASETLDERFTTSLSGVSREFAESSNSLLYAFLFALVIIYLVLAGQFESFVDPLIIMFTVPLALAGALLSLWLFNQTINIFSQIGIIVLVGIVTKNGILIVEFANHKLAQGLDKRTAVLEASAQRLRPILMTSLATALGAVPIAFALGSAATSRIPMGIVIIGGLIFSLVLTLYVIPSLYMLMKQRKGVSA